MIPLLSLAFAPAPVPVPEEPQVFAYLDAAGDLEVGGFYEIEIDLALPPGASAAGAGMPAPILQVDAPACVELAGTRLSSFEELAANEFLAFPEERLLEGFPARIELRLVEPPAEGDRIGLIVTGYVGDGSGGASFLRQRLEQPLVAGTDAELADPKNSAWGRDEGLVAIGAQAPAFELPRPNGELVRLADQLGEKNVLVLTFRAHW